MINKYTFKYMIAYTKVKVTMYLLHGSKGKGNKLAKENKKRITLYKEKLSSFFSEREIGNNKYPYEISNINFKKVKRGHISYTLKAEIKEWEHIPFFIKDMEKLVGDYNRINETGI